MVEWPPKEGVIDKGSRFDAAELLHDAFYRRRHLAQIIDVRLRRRDDDLLFPWILTNPRDALPSL